MASLHNFDRSLDKFLAWLSEAESSIEGLEAEADRLGGKRDQGALRRPQHQLKVRLTTFTNLEIYVTTIISYSGNVLFYTHRTNIRVSINF